MVESIIDTFLKGGWVMFPIVILSFVLWFLIIERILFFRSESSLIDYRLPQSLTAFFNGRIDELKHFCDKSSGITVQFLRKIMQSGRLDINKIEGMVNEAYLVEFPKFERHLGAIAVLTSVAPLLGLLGTVCGMIITFDVITSSGTGDAYALSRGIAQALISTQTGLIVALPGLLMHSRLENKAQRMTQELKKILMQMSRWAKTYDEIVEKR